MNPRRIRILGTGLAVPERKVTDQEIERELELPVGWVRRTGGVETRHWVTTETAAQLGAAAARMALARAEVAASDLDLIISAGGTEQQPIPCTAVFVQRELGLGESGIPAFDIDATCLSFLMAFDVASQFIEAGRYRRVLVVSPDIASVGLNPRHKESYTILGDGAGAVVLGPAEETSSAILTSRFNTWSSQAELCQIKGGGTKLYPTRYTPQNHDDFLFEMDGMGSFRFVSQVIDRFTDDLLRPVGRTIADIDFLVPHQASRLALDLVVKRRLRIPSEKMIDVLAQYGNTIAASIPMALHEAVTDGRIRRGHTLLLMGSSAGVSLGGTLLVY